MINIHIGGEKKVAEEEKKQSSIKFNLKIRKSLDGNLIIYDHEDIDIIIIPQKMKVLTLVSDLINDKVYDVQNRMFRYLVKKGVITPESVKAGNVYGSIEGVIPSSEKPNVNPIDITLLSISKWMDTERPHFAYLKSVKKEEEERLLNPDDDQSTELGEVPEEDTKGSVGAYGGAGYGYMPYE